MADITLKGNPCNTTGELPSVGSEAPDFKLTSADLADVSLADYSGKKKLLNIVPSQDTPVCSISTIKFNQSIKDKADAVALVISADLPFAQKRFCGAEGVENVISLSMMRSKTFAKDYGMLIENGPLAGLSGRAVVVLDEDNKVIYSQLVTEITDEPDYDAALAALG